MKIPASVIKNISALGSLKVITSLLPLLVVPYLLSVIGVEKYGVIIFALAFVAYFNVLIDYSFKVTAVREVSKVCDNQKELNLLVSKVISTKVFLLLFSLFLGAIIIFLTPTFSDEKLVFLVLLLSLIGNALIPNWLFIGLEKMEYIAILTFVFKVLHVVAVFSFIKAVSDYWLYALIISAETVLLAIAGILLIRFKYKLVFQSCSFSEIKEQLTKNRALFFNQLVPNLYNNTTTLILGFFTGPLATGVYGVLRKVVNVAEHILAITSNAFFPAIVKNNNLFRSFLKFHFLLIAIIGICMGVSAEWILAFFQVHSTEAIIAFIVLLVGLIGLALYDVYGLNFFLIREKDNFVFRNTLLFSLLGFGLSFPLIYWQGLIGAAIIVSGTRLLIGSSLFIKYQTQD